MTAVTIPPSRTVFTAHKDSWYTPTEYQGISGGRAFDYASLADYEQPNTNEDQHGG
jgi:hypothetical protein